MGLHAIRQNGPVRLIDLDQLDPDDLIVPGGMIGAPTVMVEKIPNGRECFAICDTLAKRLGHPAMAA